MPRKPKAPKLTLTEKLRRCADDPSRPADVRELCRRLAEGEGTSSEEVAAIVAKAIAERAAEAA